MKRKSVDHSDEQDHVSKRLREAAAVDRFSNLSDEILLEVLNKLDAQDILVLQSVSRRFRKICQDQLLWKKLFQRDFKSRGLKYAGPNATWTQNYRLNYNWAHGIFRQRYIKVGYSSLQGVTSTIAYDRDWAYVVVARPKTCIWDLRMSNLKNGASFHDRLRDDLAHMYGQPPVISVDTGSHMLSEDVHRFAVTWPDASVRVCIFNSSDHSFKKKLHKLRGPNETPRGGPPKAAYMHPYYAQFTTQPSPQLRLIMFPVTGDPVVLHRMTFIPDPSAMHLQWRKVDHGTALCAVWSIPLRRDRGRSIAVQEFKIPEGEGTLETSSAFSSKGLAEKEISLDDLPLETQFILNYTHPYVTLCNQGNKTCRYTLCTDDTTPEARVKIDIPYNLYAVDAQIQGEAKVNSKGRVVTNYSRDFRIWEAEDAYTRHFHPSGRREKVMDICVQLRLRSDTEKLIALATSTALAGEPQSATPAEDLTAPTLDDFCRCDYAPQSLHFDDARIVTLNVCWFSRRDGSKNGLASPFYYLEVLDFDFFMTEASDNC